MADQEPVGGEDAVDGVRSSLDGAVLTLRLDHPRKLNALTWRMYDELEQHARDVAGDPRVRAVVLTSTGDRAFAAGTDIAQFPGFDADAGLRYEQRVRAVLEALQAVPVPVVAAVPGLAVGAGLVLAAACDLVVAAEDVQFGAPVSRTLGNCIDASAVELVRRRLGAARTDQLLLAADLVSAAELAPSGFITRLLPAGSDPRPVAAELARTIAGGAPLSVRALKQTSRRLDHDPEADCDDLVGACYGSADFAEGVQAFLARRPASWEGR
ncbi:enoyl-CoA hydratase-related protein [Auraticoccus monumenti]|uniref:Enoyl-CoA hydratase/carnithine racemase n=1 Tax=Auraticoccus monumenti TaxID=675864 RepID=A0A1G6VDL2_9ACTN|nr:enoyl-CoA hydratase-related protein [Auraticoccus monumenti]SDD51601.1 Enoyl-CoA hydratase/carnithine racemase [Auraticoccus monumenti]